MSKTDHNHNEMSSQYCPVCGEELANEELNLANALELYAEKHNLFRILITRDLAKTVKKLRNKTANSLTGTLEGKIDAPTSFVSPSSEPMDSDIVVLRKTWYEEKSFLERKTFSKSEFIETVEEIDQ